ncbi:hypothetical protein, partial [Microseira wollei]|uniref:hypothetical protein n=1 Tax=Microseira wollei TaxID=467598 RepID=UPI001CFDCDEE
SLPCPKAIGSFYPIGCRGTGIERIFVTWKAFLCRAPKQLALFQDLRKETGFREILKNLEF